MKQTPPPILVIAVALAALAGMVDVIAFLALGGFFAAFMSGNSTRLAIGIAGNWHETAVAAGLIASFLGGVIGATLLGHRLGAMRQVGIMALVTLLIALCALIAVPGAPIPLMLLAAAMGAENALFERDGEVAIGLTYMTGTLVKLGQSLARAMAGDRDADDWQRWLTLWLGFLSGGMIGAGLYARIALTSLWVAVLGAALVTALLWLRTRTAPAQQQPDADQHG